MSCGSIVVELYVENVMISLFLIMCSNVRMWKLNRCVVMFSIVMMNIVIVR